MNSDLTLNAGISGIIGVLAPFVLPFLFSLISKITKKTLKSDEKRLVITLLSVGISFIVICTNFDWVGDWKEVVVRFVTYLSANYLVIKGSVQTIYELILKGSGLDVKLEKAAK